MAEKETTGRLMFKRAAGIFATAAFALIFVGTDGVLSEDDQTAFQRSKEHLQPLIALNAAYRLFAFAKAHDDVLAMAAAAKVVGRYRTRAGGATMFAVDGLPHLITWLKHPDDMLREAEEAAGNNADEISVIEKVRASLADTSRETIHTVDGAVEPKSQTAFTWEIANTGWTGIGLNGQGKSDLDLEILSPSGERLCMSQDAGDLEFCTFRPEHSGEYTVRVINHGDDAVAFQLYWPV